MRDVVVLPKKFTVHSNHASRTQPAAFARVGMAMILCLRAMGAAQADEATDIVDPVIVTATRAQRPLSEVPMSASVVSDDQIQDTAAQSLDDVLRHEAGMNLPIQTGTQAHPTADNISMRGLGGIHALLMIDGIPVNDPFFGYVQWGRIPLENIDHVEIVRGGGSPLWGNYAMGGAVNVITRTSPSDAGSVEAGYGSFGTYRANLFGTYGVGGGNRLTINANASGTSGFQSVPDYARRPFDEPTTFAARNLSLADRVALGPDLVVEVGARYHENHQLLDMVLSTNQQNTAEFTASVKKNVSSGQALTGTMFHTDSRFVTDNPTVPNSTAPLAQQTEHIDNIHTTPYHNTGGSVVWSQDAAGIVRNWIVGSDVNRISGYDSAAIFDSTGINQIRTDTGSGDEDFLGLFSQVSIKPLDALEVLVSGRLQRFSVVNGYDGNPGGAGVEPNRSYSSFDPRLSLRYALTPLWYVRAAAYQAFRAPTLDNLYRGFASNGGIYYPNAQLQPEKLHGGELGIDFVSREVRAQFTAYRTLVSNLITTANLSYSQLPSGFFYGGRLVNAASAVAQGIEVQTEWKIARGWFSSMAYTFADSVYQSNPNDTASVGQQLTDVPRHTLSASLSYQSVAGWRLAGDARYISATSWASADHTDPGFPNQAAADPHLVIDMAARYRLRENLEALAQVQNLLNRRYIVNPGPYNPPEYGTPFALFVGLRYSVD